MAEADRQESRAAKMIPSFGQADRLGICNGIGIFILIAAILVAGMVFGDALLRINPHQDVRVQLVRTFGFNRLTLVPSGRARRLADAPNQALDWRYDPRLVRIPPGMADLILTPPD
jgi:hypothetical protein